MKTKRTYVVLGLGIFGSTIAKELNKYHQDVIAIDKDMACVERMGELVSNAVCCDFTDLEQLKAAGVEEADVAVVAAGSHLEDAVLAIMNLKELNISFILAKAKNRRYANILKKIGADRVITPEKEMGYRMAKSLLMRNIIDVVDIDNEYSIIEIKAPASWVNKNLVELDLRNKMNINVLGIKTLNDEHLNMSPDPYKTINDTDHLLIVVKKEIFANNDELERIGED